MSMHSYANFSVCIPLEDVIKHLNLEKDYQKIKTQLEPNDEQYEILFQKIIDKIEQTFGLEKQTSILNVDFTDDADYAGFDGDEGLYLCIDFDAMFKPTPALKMLQDRQLDPVLRSWVTIG